MDACPIALYMQHLKKKIQEWQWARDTLIIGGDWNMDTTKMAWTKYWQDLGLYEPKNKEAMDPRPPTTMEFSKLMLFTFTYPPQVRI